MISRGNPSLGEASDDFNLRPMDLSSDYLRFRCNKAYDPTSAISLNDLGGTVTSLQRDANQSYYVGGTDGADARKVQQTKYDPGNIIDASKTKTQGKSRYDPSNFPNGVSMETLIERTSSSSDCAISQIYLGSVAGGGTYDLDLFRSPNSIKSCETRLEVIVWSDGWMKGSGDYYVAETISTESYSTSFTLPLGTRPWLTVILQCIVNKGKDLSSNYIVNTGRLVCTKQ